MKILISEQQLDKLSESNVMPLAQRWHRERKLLKNYLVNYGKTMVSRENNKEYKVILDTFLSNNLGINYCICIQFDSMTNEVGDIIYVRAYDKFMPKVV